MTTRTTIHYDGEEYVVARTADELKAEIEAIVNDGGCGWLAVNHGRGQLRSAELFISAGVTLGLVDTSDPLA